MDKTDVWFEEKILKLKTKLVIYRNVLGNKNIKDRDVIGIKISKEIIEYKTKNIKYLNELEKELKNIYETLTEDVKKKEAFRKNLLNWVLDWVKKYVEYLKNEKKKVI